MEKIIIAIYTEKENKEKYKIFIPPRTKKSSKSTGY